MKKTLLKNQQVHYSPTVLAADIRLAARAFKAVIFNGFSGNGDEANKGKGPGNRGWSLATGITFSIISIGKSVAYLLRYHGALPRNVYNLN